MILGVLDLPGAFHVTAQYSNAVLTALMPYFSATAQKLDLLPHPLTQRDVISANISGFHDSGIASIRLKSGWGMGFAWGYVYGIELDSTYFTLSNLESDRKAYFGTVRMNQDEAVQLARDFIRKMGIPLEMVYAEQEPRITLPKTIQGTNTFPYYSIAWRNPERDFNSAIVGVNADAKRVEYVFIYDSHNLSRPPPRIDGAAVVTNSPPAVNPERIRELTPLVLAAVDKYGKTLNLPLPRPLTPNRVAQFTVVGEGITPYVELELTNGWQFTYRGHDVIRFNAPDTLFRDWFHQRRPGQLVLIKDYVGPRNLTEQQAIELVHQALVKLNYPTNLARVDFPPSIGKPTYDSIPRRGFGWSFYYTNRINRQFYSEVTAEVDLNKGELKSLSFDDSVPPVIPYGPVIMETNPASKPQSPPPVSNPPPPFKRLERTIGK